MLARCATILTLLMLASQLLFNCQAQVRNGDAIQRDPFFQYSDTNLAPSDERDIDELLEGMQQQASSKNSDQTNDHALLLIQDLQIDRGEILFFTLLAKNGRYQKAYWNLGRLYALLHEEDRANRIYRRAVLQSGLSQDAIYQQAAQFDGSNRQWEARLLMQQLHQEKKHIPAGLWLAGLAYTKGDYTEALQYYEGVLHRNPKQAGAYFGIGLIYYNGENYALAESYLQRALQHGSTEPRLVYLLARAQARQEQLDQALKTIKTNLPQKPERELVALYGDLLLEKNFQHDVRFLLRYRPEVEHPNLLQQWYGGDANIYLKEVVVEFKKAF